MDFDVIIIGSGQAGVPLATRLAGSRRRVLLVERKYLGGTCINYGCTPTKTMIASARAAHVARNAARLGVHTGEVRVDLAEVVERKERLVRQWREAIRRRLEAAGPGLVLLEGEARFTGEREIEVDGERYQAPIVILDTGARTVVPPLPGLDTVPWLDNVRLMELRELPSHLVILGGGYIACEFGQMFRRFGAAVTLVERSEHLLGREDLDVSGAIETVFRAEGIQLLTQVEVTAVARAEPPAGSREAGVVLRLRDRGDLRASHLAVAVGRRPNTDGLGCERAGIRLDKHGAVIVDNRYETSSPGVYAVGDVTGGPQFTHTSWDDHRILFDILQGRGERGRNDRLVPYVVFTDPQVARVGLSEREAVNQGIAFEMATMPFGDIARAVEVDEAAGTMKVLLDPKTERILGAGLVGLDAGELLHIFVDLMQAGATARAIVDAEHVHPTFAEGVQTLVMRLPRYRLS